MTSPAHSFAIVQLIEADKWRPQDRRSYQATHRLTDSQLADAEGLARRSLGLSAPQSQADREGARAAFLAKVEATRIDAMVPREPDEAKPNHPSAVRCLVIEGQVCGWLGAEKVSKEAPPDARDDREVWREAIKLCPPELLAELLREQREAKH